MQSFSSEERSKYIWLASGCLKVPSQASTWATWSWNRLAPFAFKTSPKYQHLPFSHRLSFENQISLISRFYVSLARWKSTEQGRWSPIINIKSFGGHWNTSLNTARASFITATIKILFLLSVISVWGQRLGRKGGNDLAHSP